MRRNVHCSVSKPAAIAPRSSSHPNRVQAAVSRRPGRPVRGRARSPPRPSRANVAAQRHTLARLTPTCRAIAAWCRRPWRNSTAAASRRSSVCAAVKCVGRQTSAPISRHSPQCRPARCYTISVKVINWPGSPGVPLAMPDTDAARRPDGNDDGGGQLSTEAESIMTM